MNYEIIYVTVSMYLDNMLHIYDKNIQSFEKVIKYVLSRYFTKYKEFFL